jgi:putative nucleotidyltransferase with HDIG domain
MLMSTSPDPIFDLTDDDADPVFVVDDDPAVLKSVQLLLERTGHDVRGFTSPDQALAEMSEGFPKVLVTDLDMPGMSGLTLAEKALEIDGNMRVIMVTGVGNEQTAQAALRLGITDYVMKPIGMADLSRAVQKALLTHVRNEYAQGMDEWLREEVRRQVEVVQDVTVSTLDALLNALETRSTYFRGHSQTVAECAAGIARALDLPAEDVRTIRVAGLLHDIGMMGVPDAIVNKSSALDAEEYEAVKAHCRDGAEILAPMTHLGDSVTYVLEHHERVDGTGYPDGKRGDELSLGGQIVGLAEAWTALTEDRPHRERLSNDQAIDTLMESAGAWFAPDLIEALRRSKS